MLPPLTGLEFWLAQIKQVLSIYVTVSCSCCGVFLFVSLFLVLFSKLQHLLYVSNAFLLSGMKHYHAVIASIQMAFMMAYLNTVKVEDLC